MPGRERRRRRARRSPFTEDQVPSDELARTSADYFAIGCDNAMFGVDDPHFESVFPETKVRVDALVRHPSISAAVARKILCENAAGLYGFDLESRRPRWTMGANLAVSETGCRSEPL